MKSLLTMSRGGALDTAIMDADVFLSGLSVPYLAGDTLVYAVLRYCAMHGWNGAGRRAEDWAMPKRVFEWLNAGQCSFVESVKPSALSEGVYFVKGTRPTGKSYSMTAKDRRIMGKGSVTEIYAPEDRDALRTAKILERYGILQESLAV